MTDELKETPTQETPTLVEPSLNDILFCNQGSFAYLNPNVPKDYLETVGIGPCVAFVLRDSKADLTVMAHLDAKRGFGKSVNEVLSYLRIKHLTSGELDQAWVVSSQQADQKDIDEVANALRKQTPRVFVRTDGWANAIIVNRNGEVFNVTDIKPRPLFETKVESVEMRTRQELLCENEVLEEKIRLEKAAEYENENLPKELQDEDIFPGTGRRWHVLGTSGYGGYGVRIESPSSNIPALVNKLAKEDDVVLKPFEQIQKPQTPSPSSPPITIAIQQHKSGKFYYEVYRGGYKLENDVDVVKKVNAIAAEIFRALQQQTVLT